MLGLCVRDGNEVGRQLRGGVQAAAGEPFGEPVGLRRCHPTGALPGHAPVAGRGRTPGPRAGMPARFPTRAGRSPPYPAAVCPPWNSSFATCPTTTRFPACLLQGRQGRDRPGRAGRFGEVLPLDRFQRHRAVPLKDSAEPRIVVQHIGRHNLQVRVRSTGGILHDDPGEQFAAEHRRSRHPAPRRRTVDRLLRRIISQAQHVMVADVAVSWVHHTGELHRLGQRRRPRWTVVVSARAWLPSRSSRRPSTHRSRRDIRWG